MSNKTENRLLSFGPSRTDKPNESKGEKKDERKDDHSDKERATFYIERSYLETLARAKYWDREDSFGDIIQKALKAYWANKKYEPIPPKED